MKTFVINLDSATERLKKVTAELKYGGILSFERIPATLGKTLSTVEKRVFASNTCTTFCPDAVLGVTISHLKTWRLAIDQNHPYVLICEDDISVTSTFLSEIEQAIQELPQNWDILWAGCLFCEKVSPPIDLLMRMFRWRGKPSKFSEKLWIPPYAFGAHSYVVSRKGLWKLIENEAITEAVDVRMNRMLRNKELNGYAFRVPIAKQKVETRVSSMTSNFPSFANKTLDGFRIATDVSLAYGLSFPLLKQADVNINGWTGIFFVLGMGSQLFKTVWPFYVFLSLGLLDVLNEPKAVLSSFIAFFLGFAFAVALKNSISDKK